MIGRWYDPIERKWHEPRVARPVPPPSAYETEVEKGYRIAREQAIWRALVSTAEASRQEEKA